MGWDGLRDWGALALAVVLAIERAAHWILRKQFATTGTVASMAQAMQDQEHELRTLIVEQKHRIDLVLEQMKGIPGYDQINDIKREVAQLGAAQAAAAVKLDGMADSIDHMRDAIDRLGEDVRRR
jgi:hypothetical protein